eukprot:12237142-Alexandrium_andersonii.AAC.1
MCACARPCTHVFVTRHANVAMHKDDRRAHAHTRAYASMRAQPHARSCSGARGGGTTQPHYHPQSSR